MGFMHLYLSFYGFIGRVSLLYHVISIVDTYVAISDNMDLVSEPVAVFKHIIKAVTSFRRQ